jgi:glycosyltransferase involved in cell wall biosynthesis
MKNAFCQIQPSLYEGFGLPVVESMQSGTVVMVANNSSLQELVEMTELKFETNSVEDFVEKIITLTSNEKLYLEAKQYCIEKGTTFSWIRAANDYVSLFRSITNECKSETKVK